MRVFSIGRLWLSSLILISQAACNVTSGYNPPGHVVHVKRGVSQAAYEADVAACTPAANVAASNVPVMVQTNLVGGVGGLMVAAARRDAAFREGLSQCLIATRSYARREFAEDPTQAFPGMGNEQLRRLNAHVAAGNEPRTFVP